MDRLWDVARFCRWRYGLSEGERPTKSQYHVVERMCARGRLPAVKLGGRWFIDTTEIMEGVANAG